MMIFRKLTCPLLRMMLRYIRRQTVTRSLDYCRRAGWPENALHSIRWVLIVLFRLSLRLLKTGLIQRHTAASFRPDNASC